MEPEDVEGKIFLTSLRGYDRSEVDAFLKEAAEELRSLKALTVAAAKHEKAGGAEAADHYRRIGEETSRILLTAEEAGRAIRDQAQRDAAEIIATARMDAQELVRAARGSVAEAESELKRFHELRSILAGELEEVRRRLDETIARLKMPMDPKLPGAAPAAAPLKVERLAPSGGPGLDDLLERIKKEREESRRKVESVLHEVSPEAQPIPRLAVASPADAAALARRDEAIGDSPAAAARRLKRALQEDQAALVDRIKVHRGTGNFETDIAPLEQHVSLYVQEIGSELESAYARGRREGGDLEPTGEGVRLEDLIGRQLTDPLRVELRRAVDVALQGQQTPTAVAERASDVFRVWKGVRSEMLGEGLAQAAYHRGLLDAWETAGITGKRWVEDLAESDCPRGVCAQNAGAGTVATGEPFPSGHSSPPAHGGCTCTMVADSHG